MIGLPQIDRQVGPITAVMCDVPISDVHAASRASRAGGRAGAMRVSCECDASLCELPAVDAEDIAADV